ncbi:hypothetical protein [Edaphobacter flagellatus]|uniref:hypothetical protein n=1 Tax=Edaphobacter flagellatus TaxID=1933044 RepID=UPI0021B1B527|nr:hypothetical protein [Edaphobacter flagellatus]
MIRRIRIWLSVVIVALLVSGVTAFPLETELSWIVRHVGWVPLPGLVAWLERVYGALAATNREYPFLAYGTDWLAFAHLVLAVLFLGPWVDRLRRGSATGSDCRACAGDSVLLAADRLQFWRVWRMASVGVPEGYSRAGTGVDWQSAPDAAWRRAFTSYIQLSEKFVGPLAYADGGF